MGQGEGSKGQGRARARRCRCVGAARAVGATLLVAVVLVVVIGAVGVVPSRSALARPALTGAGPWAADVHVPGAPTDPVALGSGGHAPVSWFPPDVDGGAQIEYYTVTASPGGATCVVVPEPQVPSCVVTDLNPGLTYTFTVTATNEAGTSLPSVPTDPVQPMFTDVPIGASFRADIAWLAAASITTGYPDGTFHPSEAVARGVMAAFLYRFQGAGYGPHPTCVDAPYVDVPVGSPFCGEIAWLKAQAITTGYADGTFRPNAPVHRDAVAAYLYRVYGNPEGVHPSCAVAPFADVPTGGPLCGEISWMEANGITTGFAAGTFHPAESVDRQAMAAFLHRFNAVVRPT